MPVPERAAVIKDFSIVFLGLRYRGTKIERVEENKMKTIFCALCLATLISCNNDGAGNNSSTDSGTHSTTNDTSNPMNNHNTNNNTVNPGADTAGYLNYDSAGRQ